MAGIVADVGAAAEWVAKALTGSGYRADFSPASLHEIERFFAAEAPDGRARPGGLLAAQTGSRIFALGSYVGEVIRRPTGATWSGDDDDPQAEINVALHLPGGPIIWPVQRAMKRYKNGPEDSVVAYGAVLGLDVSAPARKRRWWSR